MCRGVVWGDRGVGRARLDSEHRMGILQGWDLELDPEERGACPFLSLLLRVTQGLCSLLPASVCSGVILRQHFT